ncbi:hypothetical protein AX15_003047 [Amanita polypyramis BW_CC]|nr:hypothetical protein AX15_003047 [Amanita polypyramis BW_CC]
MVMSLAPITPSHQGKAGARRNEINKVYSNPLPIIFEPAKTSSILNRIGLDLTTKVLHPQFEGVFDTLTKSVWVTNHEHVMLLWRRGFFGKGDLSRSEPTWLVRQENARRMNRKSLMSEQVTAQRRADRKQFKLDRARAIAAVAEEAEAIFAAEGRVIVPALSGPAIPSAATWRPSFDETVAEDAPVAEEEPPEDIEHLQLTLQEACFLAWSINCLTILDSGTRNRMSLQEMWLAFQCAHLPPGILNDRFDNPFLIYYAAYHHYRSLGWVVKGGIKFCVDYLLYKRGPVFAHSEFAIIVCPVYEDPEDQASSPFALQNAEPFTWSWLSTINRVNSQVQKTLILAYVTIPARSRNSTKLLQSPTCLGRYSVREVVLRRFVPARMRD